MNLYVTFGQKYADEPHPSLPQAHPAGWLELRGFPTYLMARAVAFAMTGGCHAFDYEKKPSRLLYPRGVLMTVTYEGPGGGAA